MMGEDERPMWVECIQCDGDGWFEEEDSECLLCDGEGGMWANEKGEVG